MSTPSAEHIALSGIPKKGLRRRLNVPISGLGRLRDSLNDSASLERDSESGAGEDATATAELRIVPRSLVSGGERGLDRGGDVFWQVTGQVRATLHLRCERCFGELRHEVETDIRVGLVTREAQMAFLPEDLEPQIAVDGTLAPWDLIEDELILSLPPVPMHEELSDCGQTVERIMNSVHEESPGEDDLPARENPFAVLASLKTGDKNSG